MAIFNKPDKQTISRSTPELEPKPSSTVISSNTKIKGTINTKCTLQIDGSHEGFINAKGTVMIGNSGKIEGDIQAERLTITGYLHGTADCEYVDVRAGGNLRGKVISNNLTIDQNCSFEGESVKRTQAEKTNLKFNPQAATEKASKNAS